MHCTGLANRMESTINKSKLSETDIITKFILPAIKDAGWDDMSQIRQEVKLRDGKVIVRGQAAARKKVKSADIVLYHKPSMPLAVVEAKANKHEVGKGMQQGLDYASLLEVPFVFASNGDGFIFHDKTNSAQLETEIRLEDFPTPQQLWDKYCVWKGYKTEHLPVITQDYHDDGSGKSPRYYQLQAINKTVETVAAGQDRVLLVMATGTGKTYTAFQIIWRLWKSRAKKRILFLADRNILVDQTKTNDFQPFGTAMTKVTGRTVDPAYEIHLALYQALTGPEEHQKAFKQVAPDFFDLIVVDECHRGSAAEDSAWREILEYFGSATQIGLTATPKETDIVSNTEYFGDALYTYSLKQGIEDGFLAPYKVVRVDIDVDLQGWRPTKGQIDKHGEVIEDRIYNQKDFDRTMVIDERTELVAQTITSYLKRTDPMAKTIVFCNDIDHAERMRRALINCNPEQVAKNEKYVMKITGDDEIGKAQLDNFINPKKAYPVIATTSELMTTGVDAKTCKLVVLDQGIQSMTKFKQIIGRGTRIDDRYGKLWFTILDFKKATELPSGWEWCRLGDLELSSEAGWSPKCLDTPRSEDNWGVLKVSAVTWNQYNPMENKELPNSLAPREHLEVQDGDFLISRANTADLVAKAVIVPNDSPTHLMMSDKIIRFRFSDKVSSHYINLFNNSQFARNYYSQVAGGTSSSMKNVSREQIKNLLICLPPVATQTAIIDIVGCFFDICEQLKQKVQENQITQFQLTDAIVEQAV